MATISRLRIGWTGAGATGGGVTTLYSSQSNPSALAAASRAFFQAMNGSLPDTLTLTWQGSGDTIDDATGTINGTWSHTAPDPVNGGNTGDWAAGVGMRVNWLTNGIVRGRRVRGTTFVLPLATSYYNTAGGIDAATVSAVFGLAEDLIETTDANLVIWSRPSTSGGSDGDSHAVVAPFVPSTVTWLRSRRT